mgnify:CR=1 FL=1
MNPSVVDRLASGWQRYGPGRLPWAESRAVGGGYAMATAALLACLAFGVPSLAAVALGVDGLSTTFLVFLPVALPLVVLTAFLAGALVWWRLPDHASGLLAGLLATSLTYLFSTVLLVPLFLFATYGEWYFSVPGAVATAALFAFTAVLLTGWLTLPLGCLVGYLHERTREE